MNSTMHMNPAAEDQFAALLMIATAVVIAILLARRRWRGSGTAFGCASWMSEKAMRAAGMLAGTGLILGRTFKGALIRLPDYCHVLLCGGTGSGKGVSICIPNLLSYSRGSIVCHDTKGDLFQTVAARRAAQGERIIRLAPFNGGTDALNPLDAIPSDSPTLVDSAHALAAALVVRQEEERDPHWNDKAVEVIQALLVLVLLKMTPEDRNLNSVQDILSDRKMLRGAVKLLQELGGIPARLGNQVEGYFEKDSHEFTKEGAGIISTATRHLSFLNSELVAKAVNTSTFDAAELRKRGITLFLQIPPEQLEAQKGLLRCWVSTLVRAGSAGSEWDGETLFLLDEASALNGLPALEEMLIRGRSGGARSILAYQSASQITTAFKNKPTLLSDNCSVQLYLGAPSSYETAERLSKSLGEWTQVVQQYQESESHPTGSAAHQGGGQSSRSSSITYSENGRALLRPEELLTLDNDYLIVLQRGLAPILASRVKWYEDPEFNPAARKSVNSVRPWWHDLVTPLWRQPSRASVVVRLVAAAILGLILWTIANRANHQWP